MVTTMTSPLDTWLALEQAALAEREAYGSPSPHNFEIDFWHGNRVVTFYRPGRTTPEAEESARQGFQARFGYWPGEKLRCKLPTI